MICCFPLLPVLIAQKHGQENLSADVEKIKFPIFNR